MNVQVEVRHDHAVVCGTVVPRPPSVSPSTWLEFWESRSATKKREPSDHVDERRRGRRW